MKAIVYRENGPPDVLACEDVPKPTPAEHEVLIHVRAASLNPLDWRMMRGVSGLLGLVLSRRKSKLSHAGVDVAGTVEAIGPNVADLTPGDEVFGTCQGSFAEYACGPTRTLAIKPAGITFEQAAAIPVAGITALQGLRDYGKIQAGHNVLINGAGGGVGTFAVQLAKHFGAHVTAVTSTRNLDFVRSLGADRVIDYTCEDFTSTSDRYNVVLDNIGDHSLSACRRIMSSRGNLVIVGGGKDISRIFLRALVGMATSCVLSRKARMFVAKVNRDDLTLLADLISAGTIRPIIDRCYSLAEAADAFRYLEEWHARGKVLILPDAALTAIKG